MAIYWLTRLLSHVDPRKGGLSQTARLFLLRLASMFGAAPAPYNHQHEHRLAPTATRFELQPYKSLENDELQRRIQAVRDELGPRAADPGPPLSAGRSDRPRRPRAATATGSARCAADSRDCRYIAFCGVHFMAETADILANRPEKLAERGGERVPVDPARPGRRLLDGRHGRRSTRSKTPGTSSAK